jgi:ribonuclease T
MPETNIKPRYPLKDRFQGYLPVVIDVETGGCNPKTDALLELAAVFIEVNEHGHYGTGKTFSTHVEVFEGGKLDPKALAINQIDPFHPFRFAISEKDALASLFSEINEALKQTACRRAVLVGHNAHFDLAFLHAAAKRSKLADQNPFHAFTCFDTATLGGLAFGKTVLAKALKAANINFDKNKAHSAIYDAERTAELFCLIINKWNASIGI